MPPDPPGTFHVADNSALVELIRSLSQNSEAGLALVTIAIIDEWLLKLLSTAMRPLSNGIAERIFESNGPLYDIAPKADVAYAFNLIDDQTLSHLRAIKKVRDLFAHTREVIHFRTPEVIKACQALPGFKKDADTLQLFEAVSANVIKVIDGKMQELIFKQATGLAGS